MAAPRRICVVGGGIIGSSTAFFLARLAQARALPVEITLVEGSSVAAGASGKAGGLLALDWHGPATASLAALSYRTHADLAAEFGGAQRWGYRQLDTLSISADCSGAKAARTRKLKGSDLFPWLNQDLVTGSDVLGTTDSTAQVHPEQFTTALVDEAKKLGVQLVYGTVDGLEQQQSGDAPYTLHITPLETTDPSPPRDANTPVRVSASRDCPSSLSADQVVIAAGPWTGELLKRLGLGRTAGRAKAIRGSRAHSVVIRPPKGKELPAQALFTSIKEKRGHAEPEIYNRPDGTSYACGPSDGSPLPTHASVVTVDDSAISSLLAQTAQLSPSHLSPEEGATVERRQACYLPVGSGDPVLGRVDGEEGKPSGVYVASGHSCWGICNGPGTGVVMAELLLDGKTSSADIDELLP